MDNVKLAGELVKIAKELVSASKDSKVWKFMLSKAKEDKEWAENHEFAENPDDWSASGISVNMLKERLDKSAKELAEDSYRYFHMRSHTMNNLRGSPWPLDVSAKEQWEKISGKPIPEKDLTGSGARLLEVQNGGSYLKIAKKEFKKLEKVVAGTLRKRQSKSGKIKKRDVQDISRYLLKAYISTRSEEMASIFYGGDTRGLDYYRLASKCKATDLSENPLWNKSKGVVSEIVEIAKKFGFKKLG